MNFDWYKIFKLTDFTDIDLPSRSMQVYLDNRGLVDILITQGHEVSVLFDGVFLTLNLNSLNPFAKDERAVYLDLDGYVWIGVLV